MSDNTSTPEQKKEVPIGSLSLAILIAGIIGCAQYFAVGIIGVIRGYSIQSFAPLYIALISMLTILMICAIRKNNLSRWKQNVLVIFACSPIYCYCLIGIQQGKYSMKGKEYYRQGQYSESIQYFRKVTETWYLPLVYNNSEDSSLTKMADAYCQLGNFDKAREIYQLVQQRYHTFYGGYATKSIKSLDNGLQKVIEYNALPEDKKKDTSVLFRLANVYEYDLKCRSKALEIYTKIVTMPVDEVHKELAKKAIQELTAKESPSSAAQN
jgi:pentatricopeptide repeat protein